MSFVVDLELTFSELWREVWEYSGVSVQIYKGSGSGCGVVLTLVSVALQVADRRTDT